jgi:hypothetical protein
VAVEGPTELSPSIISNYDPIDPPPLVRLSSPVAAVVWDWGEGEVLVQFVRPCGARLRNDRCWRRSGGQGSGKLSGFFSSQHRDLILERLNLARLQLEKGAQLLSLDIVFEIVHASRSGVLLVHGVVPRGMRVHLMGDLKLPISERGDGL